MGGEGEGEEENIKFTQKKNLAHLVLIGLLQKRKATNPRHPFSCFDHTLGMHEDNPHKKKKKKKKIHISLSPAQHTTQHSVLQQNAML